MELKFNCFDEPIYDNKFFNLDLVKNIIPNDIIYLKNQIAKVLNLSHSKNKYSNKTLFNCVDIFTEQEFYDIIPDNHFILKPIIHTEYYSVIFLTNKIISLFDENTNNIFEIKSNNISQNIFNNVNINDIVKIIKFKNFIKIIEIIN